MNERPGTTQARDAGFVVNKRRIALRIPGHVFGDCVSRVHLLFTINYHTVARLTRIQGKKACNCIFFLYLRKRELERLP